MSKKRPFSFDKYNEETGEIIDYAEFALESDEDVEGSYTGVPKDGGQPVQDADDL